MFATCNMYRSKGHLCYSSHSYLLQVVYMTFQYLTVVCIPATGHVYDISIPDSFVYTSYRSCMHDISIPDSFV